VEFYGALRHIESAGDLLIAKALEHPVQHFSASRRLIFTPGSDGRARPPEAPRQRSRPRF